MDWISVVSELLAFWYDPFNPTYDEVFFLLETYGAVRKPHLPPLRRG